MQSRLAQGVENCQAITQFKDVHDGYPSYQNKYLQPLYETELNDREEKAVPSNN